MKVLVTGSNGQLGYEIIKLLEEKKIDHLGTNRNSLNISDKDEVKKVIKDYNPDVIIHCAAYTSVDKAEDERKLCYATNVLGTKYISEVCKEIDAKLIYFSTDYVFDGGGDRPFEVTDIPNPINYYGQTKYEGELEVQKFVKKYFIIRISWVFGSKGNNFVKTMLRLGKEKDEISVVFDQVGSPTYTYDLAKLLLEIIKTDKFGIYHVTNDGYCSWYEFASEIFRQANIEIKLNPIKTEDYPMRAKRPKNSRLSKTNFTTLENWKFALNHYLNRCNIKD